MKHLKTFESFQQLNEEESLFSALGKVFQGDLEGAKKELQGNKAELTEAIKLSKTPEDAIEKIVPILQKINPGQKGSMEDCKKFIETRHQPSFQIIRGRKVPTIISKFAEDAKEINWFDEFKDVVKEKYPEDFLDIFDVSAFWIRRPKSYSSPGGASGQFWSSIG